MFDVVSAQAWRCVWGERVLCFAVVLLGLQLVKATFLELLDGVPMHGYVKHLLVIIPLELNSVVEIAIPIYVEFIFFLDAPNEVVNVLPPGVHILRQNHRRPALR